MPDPTDDPEVLARRDRSAALDEVVAVSEDLGLYEADPLVERLRAGTQRRYPTEIARCMNEAADEIERLRAEVGQLKGVLREAEAQGLPPIEKKGVSDD